MDIKKHSYLLELFVVFVGLSLAFTLDRVWDNHKKSVAEENYLNGFYKDITVDYTDLDTTVAENQAKLDRLRAILRKTDKNGIPEDSLLPLAGLMAAQSKFIPQRITYETLKASGGFDIISNYKLRQNIAKLYTKYDSMVFIEESFNKYIAESVFPFLQTNFDFINNSVVDKNLSKSPELKNILIFYYSFFKARLENQKQVKDITEEVLGQLKNELVTG